MDTKFFSVPQAPSTSNNIKDDGFLKYDLDSLVLPTSLNSNSPQGTTQENKNQISRRGFLKVLGSAGAMSLIMTLPPILAGGLRQRRDTLLYSDDKFQYILNQIQAALDKRLRVDAKFLSGVIQNTFLPVDLNAENVKISFTNNNDKIELTATSNGERDIKTYQRGKEVLKPEAFDYMNDSRFIHELSASQTNQVRYVNVDKELADIFESCMLNISNMTVSGKVIDIKASFDSGNLVELSYSESIPTTGFDQNTPLEINTDSLNQENGFIIKPMVSKNAIINIKEKKITISDPVWTAFSATSLINPLGGFGVGSFAQANQYAEPLFKLLNKGLVNGLDHRPDIAVAKVDTNEQ